MWSYRRERKVLCLRIDEKAWWNCRIKTRCQLTAMNLPSWKFCRFYRQRCQPLLMAIALFCRWLLNLRHVQLMTAILKFVQNWLGLFWLLLAQKLEQTRLLAHFEETKTVMTLLQSLSFAWQLSWCYLSWPLNYQRAGCSSWLCRRP